MKAGTGCALARMCRIFREYAEEGAKQKCYRERIR